MLRPRTRRLRRPPRPVVGGAAVLALVALVPLHLGLGASAVGPLDVAAVLLGQGDAFAEALLLGARLPRTVAGLVTGAALGVAGTLIQGATRNRLAAPDTLGVSAGAYLAVVAVAFTGVDVGLLGNGGVAFLGGSLALLLVYLLAASGLLTPGRVLLAGATVGLAGTAAADFLQILDENSTRGLYFWGQGSLLQTGLTRPLTFGAVVAVAMLATPAMARPLDLLSLGDDTAQALGVHVSRVRLIALLVAVVLTAAAVTVAGPVAFVGLLAPIAVSALGFAGHAYRLLLAGVVGAGLVLGADAAAQLVLAPSAGYGELPVGVVTGLVGGPVFVLIARRLVTGDVDDGAAVTASPPRSRHWYAVALATGVVAVGAAVLVGLRVGDVPVSWSQILGFGAGGADPLVEAVLAYRLPRVLVAAATGACLAIAGAAVQAVVRNPLAEPGLLGVTQGAAVGAVAVILLVPGAPAPVLPAAAAVGGVATLGLVVLAAASADGLSPTRVVLVGLGWAYTAAALIHLLVVGSQMNLTSALTWLAGSTYARDATVLGWLVLPTLAGLALLVAARAVDLLGLGEDVPRTLGLSLGRARLLVLGAAAVLAAGAAAAVGTVGYVGLVAPHLARRLVGGATVRLVPLCAVLGALLVVSADALGRALLAPTEVPVGVVTALLGAPYLLWLLRRTGVR